MTRPYLRSAFLACPFLFVALLPMPYGYYILLRWIVTVAAVMGALAAAAFPRRSPLATAGVLIGLALACLFNPFVPVPLTRAIWGCLDIGAIAIFWGLAVLLRAPEPPLMR